jgi:hypothetical protein
MNQSKPQDSQTQPAGARSDQQSAFVKQRLRSLDAYRGLQLWMYRQKIFLRI